ncbi:MAG: hypothetical protein ACYDC6_09200, partial [Acidobacteriaceae bacterium]
VGLIYYPADGRAEGVTLLRCNGKYGEFNRNFELDDPHYHYHIHKATEEAMEQGFRPEMSASKTSEFASFEGAVSYFVKAVNLRPTEVAKYFAKMSQNNLQFD